MGAQSTLEGKTFCRIICLWEINQMAGFYMINAWNINKIPEFYSIFARRMIFFPNFGQKVPHCGAPLPHIPSPMTASLQVYTLLVCLEFCIVLKLGPPCFKHLLRKHDAIQCITLNPNHNLYLARSLQNHTLNHNLVVVMGKCLYTISGEKCFNRNICLRHTVGTCKASRF